MTTNRTAPTSRTARLAAAGLVAGLVGTAALVLVVTTRDGEPVSAAAQIEAPAPASTAGSGGTADPHATMDHDHGGMDHGHDASGGTGGTSDDMGAEAMGAPGGDGHDHGDMGHGDMGHSDMGHGDMGHGDMGHGLPPLAEREAAATPDQQAAAWTFAADTKAAIAPYQDVHAALAAGFRPNPTGDGNVIHYPNNANRRDDKVLDPTAPEGLVYQRQPDGSLRLLGAVYTVAAGQEAPTPAGPMFEWHTHQDCPTMFLQPGQCPDTFRMLHVWTADGVVDPFTQPFTKATRPA